MEQQQKTTLKSGESEGNPFRNWQIKGTSSFLCKHAVTLSCTDIEQISLQVSRNLKLGNTLFVSAGRRTSTIVGLEAGQEQ